MVSDCVHFGLSIHIYRAIINPREFIQAYVVTLVHTPLPMTTCALMTLSV